MRYILGVFFCALLTVGDQVTKWLATKYLDPAGARVFINHIIEFRYHINEGAAFGIFQGGRWPLLAITAVVLAALGYFYVRLPKKGAAAAISRAAIVITVSGALGNAIDRFRNGYVVDFLNFTFIDFPVFNVADMCIVGGTILFAIMILFFYREPAKAEPVTASALSGASEAEPDAPDNNPR